MRKTKTEGNKTKTEGNKQNKIGITRNVAFNQSYINKKKYSTPKSKYVREQ